MIINVETTKLHRALATIVRFASKDADSPLRTVRIEGTAGAPDITLVATNGHMIARYQLDLDESLEDDVGVICVAPSVQAAIVAIAPYAKAAEVDRKQCSLFAAGGSTTIDFDGGFVEIATEGGEGGLRVPLQDPPGQMSYPPWRQFFVRTPGRVQTIGLSATYVKEIAAAFASCDPEANLYWQFGSTAAEPTLVRSEAVDQLEVMLMPLKPKEEDGPNPKQATVPTSSLGKAVADFRDAMAQAIGPDGSVTITAQGRAPVVIAGKTPTRPRKTPEAAE